MMLAAKGFPGLEVLVATLVGGTLAAGAANALNCYVDRDIDAVMRRTARRPLVRSVIPPRNALVFGLVLAAASVAGLWLTTNALSALLALGAIAFYVLIYTMLLKRRTSSNIVWGGAAGCMPVLIGWSAVTGSLSWAPVVLFAVVFLWTPPHFWALSLFVRSDYATAGIPMLPVVAGVQSTRRHILVYTLPMAAAAVAPWPLGLAGPLYGACAGVLSLVFFVLAARVSANRATEPSGMDAEKHLFAYSVFYLFALFTVLVADRMLPW
jgi:heme o synthase